MGTTNRLEPLKRMSLYIARYLGSKMFNTCSEYGKCTFDPSGKIGSTTSFSFVTMGSVSVAFETFIKGNHCIDSVQSFFTPSSYDPEPDASGEAALVVNNKCDLRLFFLLDDGNDDVNDETRVVMFRSVFLAAKRTW